MLKLAAVFILLMTMLPAAQAARRKLEAAPFRAAVQSELRDPNAAFEGIRVHHDAVCGTVEAKNDLGASTGRMLFVYVQSERKAYVLDTEARRGQDFSNAAIAAYQQYCQR